MLIFRTIAQLIPLVLALGFVAGCGSVGGVIDQRTADCTGLPDHASWNSVATIVQIQVAGEWIPSGEGTYSESESTQFCYFKCDANYTWNSTNAQCEDSGTNDPPGGSSAETRTIDCTGLPAHATWNTVSSITQTMSGGAWAPSEVGSYQETPSTTSCVFDCDAGYVWIASQCVPSGALDLSFNTTGYRIMPGVAGGVGVTDQAYGCAVDEHQRVLAAVMANNGANLDMVVVRFNEDGSIDDTFANEGTFLYNPNNLRDGAVGIVLDDQQNIYICGSIGVAGQGDNSAVVKLTPDGGVDTTFGVNGVFSYNFGALAGDASYSDYCQRIVRDPITGSITGVGVMNGAGMNADIVVWRITADGDLDTTFNAPLGYTYGPNEVFDGTATEWVTRLFVDESGRILLPGYSMTSDASDGDLVLWRYLDDGTVDTAFGNPNGYITFNSPDNGFDDAYDGLLGNDGKYYLIGDSLDGLGTTPSLIVRFNTDGTLDTTFNSGVGYVRRFMHPTWASWDESNSGVVDASGRIVIGTVAYNNDASKSDIVIWRLNSDGSLDNSFGSGRLVLSNLGGGENDFLFPATLTLDGYGRIVGCGNSTDGSGNSSLMVFRVNP